MGKCRMTGKHWPEPLIARAVHLPGRATAKASTSKDQHERISHEGSKSLSPVQEIDMPKAIFARTSRNQIQDEDDPLQELAVDPEGDDLSEDEREAIGDLGNDDDLAEIKSIFGLIDDIEAREPTRLAYIMYRVEKSIKELIALRRSQAPDWKPEPIPEAHWRNLADEALGLLSGEARRELDEQRLMQEMPTERRASFQNLCDSRRGIALFHKAFEAQRDAWEKVYWRRALDESFGKRPWTGPSADSTNS
jgi:hypothetical protein